MRCVVRSRNDNSRPPPHVPHPGSGTASCTFGFVLARRTLMRETKLVRCVLAARPAASHRIASHRIASHRIASHRIASHRIASHRTAPHRTASHRIASHRIASHRAASHRTAPAPGRLLRIGKKRIRPLRRGRQPRYGSNGLRVRCAAARSAGSSVVRVPGPSSHRGFKGYVQAPLASPSEGIGSNSVWRNFTDWDFFTVFGE
ncbi:uncharacterized protein ACIB01_006067 [Guaruba guarouba]